MIKIDRKLLIASCVLVAVTACRRSKFYCPTALDNNCNNIDASAPPPECTSSAECVAPEAVCELGTLTCVECTDQDQRACLGPSPVCGTDHACRGCSAHTECLSAACLPGGACGDDGNVAYVDPAGAENAPCTKAAPCSRLDKALETSRRYVKMHGTTNERVTINDQDVVLLADPGARLTDTSNGVLLRIDGTSKVEIYDLEITGASGANNPGISMPPGNTATVALHRVKITGNAGAGVSSTGGSLSAADSTISGNQAGGISATNGTLTVTSSTISGNQAGGISATNGTLAVTSSTISGNQAGGISATGGMIVIAESTISSNPGGGVLASGSVLKLSRSTIASNLGGGVSLTGVGTAFDITNNFIYRNGDADNSAYGGLNLGITAAGTNRFEFNTVVDNRAAINSGGIVCSVPTFSGPNNLIARNALRMSTTEAAAQVTVGGCGYPTSLIQTDVAGLAFVDAEAPAPFDYRLTAQSTAIEQATTPSAIAIDYEGDPRPQGNNKDVGADEYLPR